MALRFPARGGDDFKPLSAGSHIGICQIVADLGIQRGNDQYPDKRKVFIRFEIPAERVEYERDGKKMEGPAVIGQAYTASMHKKANLRIFLEGWRGRKFTDEEAESFDIESILGKPVMLNVVQNSKDGRVYSNIAGGSLLPKGLTAPVGEMEKIYYGPDSLLTFEKLPERIKEKINNQIIVKAATTTAPGNDGPEYTDDDLPAELQDEVVPF